MRNNRLTTQADIANRRPKAQRLFLADLVLVFCGFGLPGTAWATKPPVDVVTIPSGVPGYISATTWTVTATAASDGINKTIPIRAYEPDGTLTNGCYVGRCSIAGSTTFTVDGHVTITGSNFNISPTSYGITATVSNGFTTNSKLTFTIPSSRYLEITIPGKAAVLCLLADPAEAAPPNSSGTGIFNVKTQYGAAGTGTADDTAEIQAAIDAAAGTVGGGTVYVPPGAYKVGPPVTRGYALQLKSKVALYLEAGAVIFADPAAPWAGKGSSTGLNGDFLVDANSTSTAEIYGRGELFCNGSVSGLITGIPGSTTNPGKGAQISPFQTKSTSSFSVYGVLCHDSTGFTIQIDAGSSNATVANVKVINRYDWQYNDGMDVIGTATANITHCFVRTHDDAATVKTGVSGSTQVSSFITYDDMVMDSADSCGFCIGAETDADIHDITASNFKVIECGRGLALLHHKFGGHGHWYNLSFTDWDVEDVDLADTTNNWTGSNEPTDPKGGYHCAIQMEIVPGSSGGGLGPIGGAVLCQNMLFHIHGPTSSALWGYSTTNNISGVTFDNVQMCNAAGTPIHLLSFSTTIDGKQAMYSEPFSSATFK
ncbi:MAG: hypothetical protein JWM57_4078 [Phycisphaerales bacterium]|nr:hypothetical protein [Phycisphaerales bacterium]